MELFRSINMDYLVRAAGAELAPSKGIYRGSSLVDVISKHPRNEDGGLSGLSKFLWKTVGRIGGVLGPVNRARGTQDCVEPVLAQAARDRGGDVRFGVECLSVEQDENGVHARIRVRETGVESVVHAKYLIACDGASSPIRTALVVRSTGVGVQGHLLNILFRLDLSELVRGRFFSLCQIETEEVRGLFTSINNSDRWVFHLSYDPSKGETIEDFTKERCEGLIRKALGSGMEEVEMVIESILPWQPSVRVVERMQHGRIVLAGDSAHVMPPWGGQGANSGIADVHNLAVSPSLFPFLLLLTVPVVLSQRAKFQLQTPRRAKRDPLLLLPRSIYTTNTLAVETLPRPQIPRLPLAPLNLRHRA